MKSFDQKNTLGGVFKNSLVQIAVVVWAITAILPIIWIIFSSFKTSNEILISPFSLPRSLYLQNYNFPNWAHKYNIIIGTYYKNSIIIIILSLVLIISISLLAGYAIAKLKVPGKNILLIIMVGMIAIPLHSLVVPLYYFFSKLNLLGNYFSVVFPLVTINLPFAIILLQAYFKEFPDELIDAAKIDGCGNLKAFFSIVVPCSLNSISAVLVINFLTIWNDFFVALIMLKNNAVRTLPVGMAAFKGQYITEFGGVFATIVIAIIPTIIIFIIFSRFMITGLTAGSIKG